MIALAVRLAVASGREALVRMAMIVVAVAVGVALLVAALSTTAAVRAQNDRYAWLLASAASFAPAAPGVDPMWASVSSDLFRGHEITVVDVAATGPHPPLPPGVTRLPDPGEYVLSPALGRLVRSHPAAELGDRYPGRQIATLGDAALPGPDALIALVGRPVAELSARPGAGRVTSINDTSPEDCGQCVTTSGVDAAGIALVLGVAGLAVLFPILVFIGAATRLSAARREQRFAALRLVGATDRQVSLLSVVESVAAAALGTVLGFGAFWLIRPAVATIPFTGERFFTSDLTVPLWPTVAALVGVPVVAAVAARFAVRRVRVSPLDVARRATPAPPRSWGLAVAAVGLAELAFFLVGPKPDDGVGQVEVYVPGFLVVMVGLVLAGPWLTMVGARLLVRRAQRPETLMAGRRLADNPGTGFRAVSGVVLALFVASVAVGAMTTFADRRSQPPPGSAFDGVVVQSADNSDAASLRAPATLDARLRAAGATAATPLYSDPAVSLSHGYQPLNGFVRCADLAATPQIGRCAPGAVFARIDVFIESHGGVAHEVWPAAVLSAATVAALPVHTWVVTTDASAAAIERVRTVLEQTSPAPVPPHTVSEFDVQMAKQLRQYEQLATVVVVTSLPIAGCSLAVSVVAGLADRRRPFSLLRLAGTPTRLLRRVIAWESVTPLLVGSVVTVASGLGAAALFTEGQLGYSLSLPGPSFWLLVGGGLVLALLVVASTFPLVERTTGADVARND